MGFEDVPDIGGYAADVIVVLVLFFKEAFGQRLNLVFRHQFHDHVLRRADQVVYIADSQHVVQVFVGSEGGIFNPDLLSVGLFIPRFKVLDQGILPEDIPAVQVDGFILFPAAQVDILFPVADPQGYGFLLCGGKSGGQPECCQQQAKQQVQCLFHSLSSFCAVRRALIFITSTITITSRKISVLSAHSAVLICVWEPFVAFTT